MQSRVTNEFFKALPLALAISLALLALILWPLGVWGGESKSKLELWQKLRDAPDNSFLRLDENGEFEIVLPQQIMEELKAESGVTTEWLPPQIYSMNFVNCRQHLKFKGKQYQLGLRSDGVVVWREVKQ